MNKRFKDWCRLCAKSGGCTKEVLVKQENTLDLRLAIEKHFSLTIESNEEAPTTVCDECYERLVNLIEFEKIVQRSQLTFKCIAKVECIEEDSCDTKMDIPSFCDVIDEDTNNPQNVEVTYLACKHCDCNFDSEKSLHDHMKSIHSDGKFSCNICGATFGKSLSLRCHRTLVHSIIRRFICEVCGRAFKRSGDLTRHKEFHRDDTPFACKICGKEFKSKLVVKMHEKNHTVEKLTCNICGQQLKTKHTLRGHMQTHTNEMQFHCKYCDKKFRCKKNLNCHLLTHTGSQPYSCVFCKQSFSLRWNCSTHQKNIHLKEMAQYAKEGRSMIITNLIKQEFSCGRRRDTDLQEAASINEDMLP